jgi:uncharacterized protein YjiS (DUF1127 family)
MFTQTQLPEGQDNTEQNHTSSNLMMWMQKLTGTQRRWHSARHLCAMNDNMLRDIGMHRSQIIASAHGNKHVTVGNENV